MNRQLIQILNDLVRIDVERSKEIVTNKYQAYQDMIRFVHWKRVKVWKIIPFFWQLPDDWGCCMPEAENGKTWCLLANILYDDERGVYAVLCRNFHSLPPDLDTIPIDNVDDTVIVAVIHLLLEEFFPMRDTTANDLLLKQFEVQPRQIHWIIRWLFGKFYRLKFKGSLGRFIDMSHGNPYHFS